MKSPFIRENMELIISMNELGKLRHRYGSVPQQPCLGGVSKQSSNFMNCPSWVATVRIKYGQLQSNTHGIVNSMVFWFVVAPVCYAHRPTTETGRFMKFVDTLEIGVKP